MTKKLSKMTLRAIRQLKEATTQAERVNILENYVGTYYTTYVEVVYEPGERGWGADADGNRGIDIPGSYEIVNRGDASDVEDGPLDFEYLIEDLVGISEEDYNELEDVLTESSYQY